MQDVGMKLQIVAVANIAREVTFENFYYSKT